jgi:hypothetical protein
MRGILAKRMIAAAAVLTVAFSLAGAASANPSTSDLTKECPAIMPLSQVTAGMSGTALSVTSGRKPTTFGVEVLGILQDAVGPGRDIIVANLTGSAVTAAGGLWAGASGSPAFFRDPSSGKWKLAGAIAYGLAGGGSTLAGITPGQDMAALLAGGGAASPRAAGRIAVPRALAFRMAGAAGVSVARVSTLVRLKTPLSASGLTSRGLARMQQAIDRQGLPFIAYSGSSASHGSHSTGALRAGDSFASAMSLGDVTVAGIGTTTFVCKGQAVAFGHPFNWTGRTTMAARAADTITIVKDPILGSYKLANIAEGVGTVTQDRLAGLVANLGANPPTSPVTSTVTDLDSGRTRDGASFAVFPDFLPFLAFEHLFQNIDVTIDRIGQGSSAVDYTISGTRDGGVPWTLTRSTRYASRFDISFDSILELSSTAEILQAFDGEDITITSIDVPRLDVEQAFEQYSIRRALVWNGSRYVQRNVVRARPGGLIRLRVVLKPAHRTGFQTVDLALRVPANARRDGLVEVFGGGSTSAEIPCFIVDEECGDESGPATFGALLRAFRNQPPGDALVARLRLGPREAVRATTTKQQDAVVVGSRLLAFELVR